MCADRGGLGDEQRGRSGSEEGERPPLPELSPKDDLSGSKKIHHGNHRNAQLFCNFFNQAHAGMIAVIHSIDKLDTFSPKLAGDRQGLQGGHMLLQGSPYSRSIRKGIPMGSILICPSSPAPHDLLGSAPHPTHIPW